jgi:hypothetical protein
MPYKDPEKRKEYKKEYYLKNRNRLLEQRRVYSKLHPDKKKNRNAKYHRENREKVALRGKKYRKANAEKERNRYRKYYQEHPEIHRKSNKKHRSTLGGRIGDRMTTSIGKSLRSKRHRKAGRHWEILVGYTIMDLKQHLQKHFAKGMTWKKFMAGEIHIDHVIPKSHFKYKSSEDFQFKECWALHNLQPLWAKDNLVKHNNKCQLPLPLE